jgi:hypothetical protein
MGIGTSRPTHESARSTIPGTLKPRAATGTRDHVK